MSTNGHSPAAAYGADDLCATFAAVLPILDEPVVDSAVAAQVRVHLAGCVRCQAHVRVYDRMEAALRRHFGPESVAPRATPEIVTDVLRHLPSTPFPRGARTLTTMSPAMLPTPAPVHTPPPAPRRSRRFISGVASLAAVLVLALLTAALLASHQRHTGPSTPRINGPPELGSDTELTSISMVSPSEGWAVGSARPANDSNGSATRVLLMHYVQGNWSRVNLPIQGRLQSVAMVSATDGWAVGAWGVMLHYDGVTWTRIPAPATLNLMQVRMYSATNGFAISPSSILHFNGTQWTPQPLPDSLGADTRNAVSLSELAFTAPDDAWVVGSLDPIVQTPAPTESATASVSVYPTTPPSALILHYTGGRWTVVRLMPGATLTNIAMISATDGWAAGHTDTFTYPKCGTTYTPPCSPTNRIPEDSMYPLLLHFAGGAWETVPSQIAGQATQPETLGAIAMLSPTDGWMARDSESSTMLHYDGSAWKEVGVPSFVATVMYTFTDVAFTSPTSGWVVGYRYSDQAHGLPSPDGAAFQPTVTPIILRYQQGAWSVVIS